MAIGTDKATGNIMMVDPAGNLYYDTGDQKLGFYMVCHHVALAVAVSGHAFQRLCYDGKMEASKWTIPSFVYSCNSTSLNKNSPPEPGS